MIDPEELMRHAIEVAQRGITAGQSPFGCAIAEPNGWVIAAHNTVVADVDITAHAEVNAIRLACHGRGDIHLTGAIVATTCEPCPMCMAALHWARVAQVHFGATISDAESAGFHELSLPAAELLRLGGSPIQLHSGMLADECRALFDAWLQRPERRPY